MDRLMMISCDGHVQAQSPEDYRPYIPAQHQADYDDYLVSSAIAWQKLMRIFHGADPNARREKIDAAHKAEIVAAGAETALFDPSLRLSVLEKDGVVAEVLFPDNAGPFGISAGGIAPGIERSLQIVGAKAYNRWLADFCSVHPTRYAGQAALWLHDVDAAVEEIRWARNAGLRGILLPGVDESLPLHFDPIYEPIWAVCAELDMPINFHIGSAGANYGGKSFGEIGPDHIDPDILMSIVFLETTFFSRRAFWFLLLSGALERHPDLKLVFTEQYSSWVPMTLAAMDYNWHHGRTAERTRSIVPRPPSEYWHRQCFVGASVLSRSEAELRKEIGVENMMFGVDFPHIESSWGDALPSTITLQATLGAAGASEAEARAILGENAARAFGFDTAALAPIAATVGPTVKDVLTPLIDAPNEAIEDKFLRSEILRPVRP